MFHLRRWKGSDEDQGRGARNYFGELALLHGAPRAATVTTTTDVVGWMLKRATFKKILICLSRWPYSSIYNGAKELKNICHIIQRG